ncbi:MAG: hypothetical protein IKY01_01780 [Prevotella sp.]|nr:hypothetical protein [Prevotella sp.]
MIGSMLNFMQNELRTQDTQAVIGQYLKKTGYANKWILLTDYCLDANNKANVISFVLLHYKNEEEYNALKEKLAKLQKSDIKHTRYISNRLMRYLRRLPIFSYSFILDSRDILFGDTKADQQKEVTDNLVAIRDCYQTWLTNAANASISSYYQDTIKKLDAQIQEVSMGKKISLHEDILLATSLGAIYTAEILKNIPDLEIVGWLPDRDKITQSCNGIAIPIFHCMLYNGLGSRDVQFPVADPKIVGPPFYDALNRIPDDICAAIADYDYAHPAISKEKFSHVLHELLAENPYVIVQRLYKDATGFHTGTIYYKKSLRMSTMFYLQTAVREVIGFWAMVKNKICR